MPCINVLVVSDDVQALRLEVRAVLAQPSLRLMGAVLDRRAAQALLDVTLPDVLLVDCRRSHSDSIELIRDTAQRHACCAVLAVTRGRGDESDAALALAAGAAACLGQQAGCPQIAASIKAVHADGLRSSLAMQGRLLPRHRSGPDAPNAAAAEPTLLTARETEILRLVEKGLLFDTVGDLLDISPHTVVAHLRKIYRKLAVHTRGEAVHEAGQMGLL